MKLLFPLLAVAIGATPLAAQIYQPQPLAPQVLTLAQAKLSAEEKDQKLEELTKEIDGLNRRKDQVVEKLGLSLDPYDAELLNLEGAFQLALANWLEIYGKVILDELGTSKYVSEYETELTKAGKQIDKARAALREYLKAAGKGEEVDALIDSFIEASIGVFNARRQVAKLKG